MKTLHLIPCYGKDYRSKKQVMEDLKRGEDFKIADISSPWDTKPASLRDLESSGFEQLFIRYQKLRKVMVVDLPVDRS